MTDPHPRPARTRFAPSPTGRLHLGSARTALYDYLLARQTGGQFILRLEDTDQKRYIPGSENEIVAGLRWLGLDWDEGFDIGGPYGPYRQSDRKDIYLEHAHWLIEHDYAYPCFCTADRLEKTRQQQISQKQNPRYDGLCRRLQPDETARRMARGERHVIRFKTPLDGVTTVRDRLRGEITFENHTLDDFVLVKSDGLALYHLAAMVDDYLMKITHVIRTAEWLPTFPLHARIIRAFGWPEPEFIHPSLFLKPTGKGKMSKRDAAELIKDGYSIYIEELQGLGYLPEAVTNWSALMGWSYDDHTEFFCLPDLIEKFSLDRLNPAPVAVNFTKFDHFNGLHIRALAPADLARRLKPFFEAAGYAVDEARLTAIAPIVQERLVTLDDAVELAGFFFRDEVKPRPETLTGKDMTAAESAAALQRAGALLDGLTEFNTDTAHEAMRSLAETLGLKPGQLFGILRMAVTGQMVSPPLFESMVIIGKAVVLERIRRAQALLEQQDQQT